MKTRIFTLLTLLVMCTAGTFAQEKKILVAYFSWSGNTQHVAEYIARQTGATLFRIDPAKPYPTDYTPCTEVAKAEKEQNARPAIKNKVDDWDSYDTVFIGYPIWWGIAAWPVDGFVEANDFTGKTVIPFCTASSSGLGQSGELLSDMAGTGEWLEGERFRSRASQEDVTAWVDSLGLSA